MGAWCAAMFAPPFTPERAGGGPPDHLALASRFWVAKHNQPAPAVSPDEARLAFFLWQKENGEERHILDSGPLKEQARLACLTPDGGGTYYLRAPPGHPTAKTIATASLPPAKKSGEVTYWIGRPPF